MIYLDLFIGFLKVGFFSFGGGYGAIPLIRDVVLSYGWLDDETLMDMIAISESTPGPIMVNLATYVGYSQAGIPGGILATVTSILPAFFIILLIMVVLRKLFEGDLAQAILTGLKSCVIGIILATGCFMIIKSDIFPLIRETKDPKPLILAVLLAGIYYIPRKLKIRKVTPITLIIISAGLGIAFYELPFLR